MSNRRKLRAQRRGVAKAEQRRAQGKVAVYDDKRRYNGYQCSPNGGCGGIWLTVDLDKGTTPMFSKCIVTKGCEGLAASMGYPKTPPPKKIPLLVEWYEPAESAMDDMTPAMFDHVQRGGLCRRPGPDAKDWQKALIGPVFPRRVEDSPTQLTVIEGGEDANHSGEASSSSADGPGDQG